jgi:hypothetical protein
VIVVVNYQKSEKSYNPEESYTLPLHDGFFAAVKHVEELYRRNQH